MNEQHSDALPPVNTNQTPAPQADQQGGGAPQTNPGPQSSMPMTDPAAAAASDPISMATISGDPQIADDVDLIEKDWVERAKQIVEQTKHDPYKQNAEMTRMKTDYLKKRYNRDIKLDDVV